MAFTPTDPTKAEVRVTGTAPNQQLDFYIPRGAKGEPGGITAGTDLLSSDLNEIKTAGIYRNAGAAGTLLLNYPVAQAGILTVYERQVPGNSVIQEFQPITTTTANNSRVTYRRTWQGSVWSPWRAYNSTRVDQTAGRAIYQWDDVNQREQLIYGDTGWRQITLDPATFSTDNGIQIRRTGNLISLRIIDTTFTTAASTTPIFYLPVGFRAQYTVNPQLQYANNVANAGMFHARLLPSYDATLPYGVLIMANTRQNLTASVRLQGEISWQSYEAWPSTLPGTAAGTIPNV